MRKIIESTIVSLDGVVDRPSTWSGGYFNDEAVQISMDQLAISDAMLMGRRTYEMFSQMWPAASGPYADQMNNIRKYVFSSTLKDAEWNNTTIVRGDVAAEVSKLKQQDGGDLVIYGHGPLGRTLLENNLLDDVKFMLIPLIVGTGGSAFQSGLRATLELTGTKTLTSGVVVLSYRPMES